VLAELARGRLRAKLPALQRALEGRFSAHHALLCSHILALWVPRTPFSVFLGFGASILCVHPLFHARASTRLRPI
jgi:hypothetical protein